MSPLRLVPTAWVFAHRREQLRTGIQRLAAGIDAGTDPPLDRGTLLALDALAEEYFLPHERAWLQRQIAEAA